MALLKLAIFLQDALILRRGGSVKPLVVFSPPDENRMQLAVGVTGPPRLSDTHGNTFSLTFRQAAEQARRAGGRREAGGGGRRRRAGVRANPKTLKSCRRTRGLCTTSLRRRSSGAAAAARRPRAAAAGARRGVVP